MKLIGQTALIQKTLTHKFSRIRDSLRTGDPVDILERRHLFTGPPGTGKTELAKYLTRLLVHDQSDPSDPSAAAMSLLNIEKVNGSAVNRETVLQWAQDALYRPLYGPVAVKWVEEIEGASPAAVIDLRTYLDDLPNHRLFLATTNLAPEQLPGPLQSRFQVWTFRPVGTADLSRHLEEKYHLAPAIAQRIAQGAAGNVRAAELDAITQVDALAALAA